MSRRFAYFTPTADGDHSALTATTGTRDPILHVTGYAAFAERADAVGADVHNLATDLLAFLDFVADHSDLLSDPVVEDSAIVFFGNVLVVAHAGATWRRSAPSRRVGTDALSIDLERALPALARDAERRRGFLDFLAGWADEDAQHSETQRLMKAAGDSGDLALIVPPVEYVRPTFRASRYSDDDGNPIHYGSRWDGSPPDDAYSRVSHPERFASLHTDADALVTHLRQHYFVAVQTAIGEDGSKTVRLDPAEGAPLVLRYTDFPGVEILAGALFTEMMPSCGCDACDETFDAAADELERTVLSVVAGGLAEHFPVGTREDHVYSLRSIDGGSSSGAGPTRPDADRHAAAALLAPLDDGRWPAWPRRDAARVS